MSCITVSNELFDTRRRQSSPPAHVGRDAYNVPRQITLIQKQNCDSALFSLKAKYLISLPAAAVCTFQP